MNDYNSQVAELLIRLFAGLLFLFQGYDKLFRIKMPGVIETFKTEAYQYHIPHPLLKGLVFYTSIVEFVGGILLLTGFLTSIALYALGLDLLLVGFAFTYMQPMWNMKHVLPRFTLIIALLFMPQQCRLFSLDHFLGW